MDLRSKPEDMFLLIMMKSESLPMRLAKVGNFVRSTSLKGHMG